MYDYSEDCLNLIKKYEGFKAAVYECPAGAKTIGFGHVLRSGEDFKLISRIDGVRLLEDDLCRFSSELYHSLNGITLRQCRIDALLSFVYNLGITAFGRSTLREKIFERDWLACPEQFIRWHYISGVPSRGLLRRRLEEASLFIKEKCRGSRT